LNTIEQLPPYVVEKYVSLDINAVEEFEDQIKDYRNKLSEEDLLKIKENHRYSCRRSSRCVK